MRTDWQWSNRVGSCLAIQAEQCADSRQPGIASSGSAPSFVFKIIEVIEDERFVDLLNIEIFNAFVQPVSSVTDQQLNGVTVSEDRIGGKALLDRQVMTKESFYKLGE